MWLGFWWITCRAHMTTACELDIFDHSVPRKLVTEKSGAECSDSIISNLHTRFQPSKGPLVAARRDCLRCPRWYVHRAGHHVCKVRCLRFIQVAGRIAQKRRPKPPRTQDKSIQEPRSGSSGSCFLAKNGTSTATAGTSQRC